MAELLVDTPSRMAEMHRPHQDPKRCGVMGACGSPLQRCSIHQRDVGCMVCSDPGGSVQLKPGFAAHITSMTTAEKLLEALRWCWVNGCPRDRPRTERWAATVIEQVELLQRRPAAIQSLLRMVQEDQS